MCCTDNGVTRRRVGHEKAECLDGGNLFTGKEVIAAGTDPRTGDAAEHTAPDFATLQPRPNIVPRTTWNKTFVSFFANNSLFLRS